MFGAAVYYLGICACVHIYGGWGLCVGLSFGKPASFIWEQGCAFVCLALCVCACVCLCTWVPACGCMFLFPGSSKNTLLEKSSPFWSMHYLSWKFSILRVFPLQICVFSLVKTQHQIEDIAFGSIVLHLSERISHVHM